MKTTALALLLAAAALGGAGAFAQDRPPGGMMGQGRMPSLKELPGERQVKSVRYCDRKYFVDTVAGDVLEFREFDLRFKTDASDQGPRRGTPALLPAGGMGDRSFLIFSDPAEISEYIKKNCAGG